MTAAAMESAVAELCRTLRLPTVARAAGRLAVESARQGTEPLAYLHELLEMEVSDRAERRAARRLKEAGLPLLKTFEGFDFSRAKTLPEARLRRLAAGDYIDRAEPILFVGDPGTGKTHLATALAVCAANQGRRVRFVTAGRLVCELIEARDAHELGRTIRRYGRVDLLVLDELGYLPLAKADAELLFQVISERHERRAIVITTNLKFAEWTQVFPDPRLCRALIDRLTHKAHIIETGTESIRLAEAMKRRMPTN
jgi:DNA replication protein DnaC